MASLDIRSHAHSDHKVSPAQIQTQRLSARAFSNSSTCTFVFIRISQIFGEGGSVTTRLDEMSSRMLSARACLKSQARPAPNVHQNAN